MDESEPHDIVSYMRGVTAEMNREYQRIRARTSEDPGTAGDEGEENWATLLRDWLPRDYQVVTKGRILSQKNVDKFQVDVLVLKPSYPKGLRNKKHYLSAGVIAAFECKTRLRKDGLIKAMENAATLADYLQDENQASYYLERYDQRDTTYIELHRPIIYGLLAHTHRLGSTEEAAREKITSLLDENTSLICKHPRDPIDLVCVSDLATWRTQRAPYSLLMLPQPDEYGNPKTPILENRPSTCYSCHYADMWDKNSVQYKSTTPIGALIAALYKKISYKDSSQQEWARYFSDALAMVTGGGNWRLWPDLLTPESRSKYDLTDPYQSNWGLDTFD